MVDLGGVVLLFRAPSPPLRRGSLDLIVDGMNSKQLSCPVQLQPLKVTPVSKALAVKAALAAAEGRGMWDTSLRSAPPIMSISKTEISTYVFPACGHVHGYHSALQNKLCPLCRTRGPFLPLSYCFEETICSACPTHVFNPCGHAISREVAQLWASIRFMKESENARAHCPFCFT